MGGFMLTVNNSRKVLYTCESLSPMLGGSLLCAMLQAWSQRTWQCHVVTISSKTNEFTIW